MRTLTILALVLALAASCGTVDTVSGRVWGAEYTRDSVGATAVGDTALIIPVAPLGVAVYQVDAGSTTVYTDGAAPYYLSYYAIDHWQRWSGPHYGTANIIVPLRTRVAVAVAPGQPALTVRWLTVDEI